jgi:hypothetical protein
MVEVGVQRSPRPRTGERNGPIGRVVVARKVWGRNRTPRGAQTQSILLSFLQTCRQQLQPALIQNLRTSSVPLSPKYWA